MTTDDQASDVPRYAAAVRAALSDLPRHQSEALLEDLEDHLREIAAEAGAPLTERLGPPEQYAQELRAAYGAESGKVQREPALGYLQRALGSVTSSAWYQQLRAFLPELRPAWWVLRAYLVVLILTAALSPGYNLHPIPNPFSSRGLLEILATIGAILFSIRLGRRSHPLRPGRRRLAIGANVVIALLALPVLASMGTFPSFAMVESGAPEQSPDFASPYSLGSVTNVFPYSKDGKPLTDVLLYDQEGRPLTLARDPGRMTDYPIGADGQPITNAYPLNQRRLDGTPDLQPRVAIPPWPAATLPASPTASPTPSPAR